MSATPHTQTMTRPKFEDFEFELRRIAPEDGGGYSITFQDLPGCMSDGETADETIANGRDAFEAWIDRCIEEGAEIPKPGSHAALPVKFVQRLPKGTHVELTAEANLQGASVNALVTVFIAEGLARHRILRETAGMQDNSAGDWSFAGLTAWTPTQTEAAPVSHGVTGSIFYQGSVSLPTTNRVPGVRESFWRNTLPSGDLAKKARDRQPHSTRSLRRQRTHG